VFIIPALARVSLDFETILKLNIIYFFTARFAQDAKIAEERYDLHRFAITK